MPAPHIHSNVQKLLLLLQQTQRKKKNQKTKAQENMQTQKIEQMGTGSPSI
jgi:predicted amino acid dehydrogenase